jgi:hypothetical protein
MEKLINLSFYRPTKRILKRMVFTPRENKGALRLISNKNEI